MSEITAGGDTRIWWVPAVPESDPVELTGSVKTITMYREHPDSFAEHLRLFFTPISVRGTVKLTPAGFRVLFGRSHPRIRRMHAAYGRRRGRGRW
jgi:hypothetical protein